MKTRYNKNFTWDFEWCFAALSIAQRALGDMLLDLEVSTKNMLLVTKSSLSPFSTTWSSSVSVLKWTKTKCVQFTNSRVSGQMQNMFLQSDVD